MRGQIGLGCLDEFRGIVEDPSPNTLVGEIPEETLHDVEPRRAGRREMKMEMAEPLLPGLHLGVLVGRVVVEDDVDLLVFWGCPVDQVEEFDPHR